ncbi:MAG TPA: PAS domain-containing protein [Salinarimonas sp.]|nr:PAS domain-containing protein [Salinarimonas sp.]
MPSSPLTSTSVPALEALSLAEIEAMSAAELDGLPFGVIGLDGEGHVAVYSAVEARYAGLPRDAVLGRHFYTAVAPCMNNALVAGRMEGTDALDATIDYVLTFRMRPTRVRIRLLKAQGAPRRYLLIQR